MQRPVLVSIQMLRGFAALAVVLYHVNLLINQHGQGSTPRDFFFVGMAGVDVFFCLSGYLMVQIIGGPGTGARDAVQFLLRRALRIVPLYWLMTFTKLALLAVSIGIASPAFPDADFILRSLFFIPAVNLEGNVQPVVAAGWTLVYEWFFYLSLFLGLLLFGRAAPLASGLALVGLVSLGAVFGTPSIELATYADPIILEFLAGMAIGALTGRWTPGPRTGRLLLALALTGFVGAATPLLAEWPRIAKFGIPSALLLLGCLGLERSFRHPAFAPLKAAGDASYSIYLCHQIVQAVMVVAMARMLPGPLPPAGSDALAILLLLTVPVACGFGLYYAVERPLTQRLMRAVRGPREVAKPRVA